MWVPKLDHKEDEKSQKEKTKERKDKNTDKSKHMVTLPYVKGVTESVQWIFKHHEITTAVKPHQNIRRILVHLKDKVEESRKTDCVHQITCKSCSNMYIGETGRTFDTRLEEHKKEVENITTKGENKVKDSRKTDCVHQITCKSCSNMYIGETWITFGTRLEEHKKEVENITTKGENKVKDSRKTDCVHQITCKSCSNMYIGETGRTFDTRLEEHKKEVENITTKGENKVKDSRKTDCVHQITCKSCSNMYIGETGRTFDTRLEEHKKEVENITTKGENKVKDSRKTDCVHQITCKSCSNMYIGETWITFGTRLEEHKKEVENITTKGENKVKDSRKTDCVHQITCKSCSNMYIGETGRTFDGTRLEEHKKEVENITTKGENKVKDSRKTDCVHQITCKSCSNMYIGETGRTFDTRLEEHKKEVENITTKGENKVKDSRKTDCVHQITCKSCSNMYIGETGRTFDHKTRGARGAQGG